MTGMQAYCRGRVCIACLETAETFMTRLVGLLGRSGLPSGTGLLLQPAGSIHTVGMRFSIDVIQLDRDWHILQVVRDVRPYRVVWAGWRVRRVIEVQSGWLTPNDMLAGECISLCPPA